MIPLFLWPAVLFVAILVRVITQNKRWATHKLEEVNRSRPLFTEFYRAHSRRKTEESLRKLAGLAAVVVVATAAGVLTSGGDDKTDEELPDPATRKRMDELQKRVDYLESDRERK